jgi:hypothetical protein
MRIATAISMLGLATSSLAERPRLPVPKVDGSSWVLIEYWPEVNDITLSAYFLGHSAEKNRNLCNATKRSLDMDAEQRAKRQKRKATSSRRCLTVTDATREGWIETARS